MSKNYPKSPVGNTQSYAGLLALELSLHLPFPNNELPPLVDFSIKLGRVDIYSVGE